MPKFENIEDWVSKKYGSQAKAAHDLETAQGVISQWVTGRSAPSAEKQLILRKKGYDGPFSEPKKKAEESAYVTREELAEERGALRAELRLLREHLENAYELLRDLKLDLMKVQEKVGIDPKIKGEFR